MSFLPLISVHVAKTGGTSTTRILKAAYGDAFSADYQDNPVNPLSQRILDPKKYFSRREGMPLGITCVHGHFHPGKFSLAQDAILFTLLRHPVDNIFSIYFFWKDMKRQNDALHDYFCDNEPTIVETARLPLLRWLLSRTYFEGFDMGRFDIIGEHSQRQKALQKLSARIGALLDTEARENTTPDSEERQEMLRDRALRRRLEDILVEDIRFFERCVRHA